MSAFDDYLSAPAAASQSFDAYVGAAPVPAPAAGGTGAAAPQTAAGQPGVMSSALVGFGKGLGNVASGVEQLAGKGANAIGLNKIGNYLTNDANYGLNAAQQGAAPYEVAHPIATGAGQMAGNMVGTAPAMALGPEFAGLGLAGKIGVGALQGAAGAAMMPVQDPGNDYWTQKAEQTGVGGLLGGAVPPVMSGTRALTNSILNTVRPVIQPGRFVGQGLTAGMSPVDAASVASNIRTAQQFVPGSIPTTAQVSGNPYLVQTEKALSNSSPDFRNSLLNRQIANNDARWSVINSIAGTPQTLDAAIQARNAAAAPAYQAARAGIYDVDPALHTLMQRPAMQQALQRGITIAQNEGNNGLTAAIAARPAQFANVPTGATGFNGQPLFNQILTRPATSAQPAQISGDVLHYMKLGMDDLQSSAAENTRLGPQERRAINSAQNDYLNWLDNASPDYAQGRAAYAANSPPVNTMTAGQRLSGDLSLLSPNGANVPNITFPAFKGRFAQALRGDPSVAQFGIDPAAQAALTGIQSDLQREMVSSSIRSPGSDTAYNVAANGWLARNLFGPSFNGATGLGKTAAAGAAILTGHPLAAGGIFAGGSRLGQAVGERLQNHLGSYLTDPQLLLPYLDARAAAPAQPVPGALVRGLINYGRPAVLSGLLGGITDAGNNP
ncbi:MULTISPECIES: hypothetical protein [Paraburkholderia]|uniref:hypothetical protein n=1 Tax=Paraburkholderia TaxID=1822464 RepID=UPI0038B99487